MTQLASWLFGPSIRGYYHQGTKILYSQSTLEAICDPLIGYIKSGFSAYCILLPWYLAYQPISSGISSLHSRYLELIQSHGKVLIIIGGIYLLLTIIRGSSRAVNPVYQKYISSLKEREGLSSQALLTEKRKWDIPDYSAWSVDFISKSNKQLTVKTGDGCGLLYPVCYGIGTTFARWMIYPGATPLLNFLLGATLEQERSKILRINSGLRAKVESSLGDKIDTVLLDRRNTPHKQGKTLFITCEGNAGFLEVGSFTSVAESSFSVLGWNHPGFGDSTGMPYPINDGAAILAVIDYAIKELGFAESEIVLYGWSIGGFSVVYGASHYNNLKGIYLDATFDDVMPLAEHVMPPAILPITTRTIKNIWNLNVSSYLNEYSGPVTILRRNRDEIMQRNPQQTNQNRANNLLINFIQNRYPNLINKNNINFIINGLENDTNQRYQRWIESHSDDSLASALIESFVKSDRDESELGKDLDDELKQTLLLYLVKKHFQTFDATHGTPLPVSFVDIPWNIRQS